MAIKIVSRINNLDSRKKLFISLLAGLVAYFAFPFNKVPPLMQFLFGWDVFVLCQLLLIWVTFYSTSPLEIRQQASKQDDNKVTIFIIMLIATFISMMAVLLLLINKSQNAPSQNLRLAIAIFCMLFSWFLVHTIFTIRYADLYYSVKTNHESKVESSYSGGLNFPDDPEPDFLDFAYFSFTAGMTFQVSDVEISSKEIRRLALLHCLISFGYNATIIAISVNIIAGLFQN